MSASPENLLDRILPELRQELQLEPGPDSCGEPTWLVVDQLQSRYIHVGVMAHQLLSCWRAGATYGDLIQAMRQKFDQNVASDDIVRFVKFLAANNLTIESDYGDWHSFASRADEAQQGWIMWLVHHYLFIKLPLFRPEPYLRKWLPIVAPLYTKGFGLLCAGAGLTGLYLISRQWESFVNTYQHTFSKEGAATYAVAIFLVKCAHELGHGFTAVRFGCRVPTMGVCFLVMFPVLYTDVTDAWRLRDSRQRLLIGAAGVIVELALACFFTLSWSFLPEGIFKSLAFSIATVGWIMSLAVNLNPLMRFDGYYLFSDAIGVDNLQARSFAFGRWKLRELLFATGHRPPEVISRRLQTTLVLYAWIIWIYRFTVYTGIALLVYHMAFKLLGIVLFLVEIIFFVAGPVASEIKAWWLDRSRILSTMRGRMVLFGSAAAACALAVPWSTTVRIPSIIEFSKTSRVFSSRPGIVKDVRVARGAYVHSGDVLADLASDEIDRNIELVRLKLELVDARLQRRLSDQIDLAKSLELEQQRNSLATELAGLEREKQELAIRAPFDGKATEMNASIEAGRAVGRNEMIALITDGGELVVRGYISEADSGRLTAQSYGTFVSDSLDMPAVPVRLNAIAKSAAQSIDIEELASIYGGQIAVRAHKNDGDTRRLVPVEAHYLVVLDADRGDAELAHVVRGTVQINATGESVLAGAARRVVAVLIRESGF